MGPSQQKQEVIKLNLKVLCPWFLMVIGKVVGIGSFVINLAEQINWLTFHLHTIWLFTRNDLKSIVLPETAFGIFSALSGPLLTTNNKPCLTVILARIPRVVLWNWLNVLIFDVANQRLPNSILEDSVNKPWRVLPARRITPASARRLLLFLIPVVFFATIYLGGVEETVLMMVLTWMYNDLEGADENYIVRNLINCAGFMCYSSGTTIVAAGYGQHTLSSRAYTWLGIVGGIVFSTLQMQDMSDVEGDKARGRRTLPIVYGDGAARWSIAIPVTIWSIICPWFWELGKLGWAASLAAGGLLAGRVLMLRSVSADKATWKIWCLWTTTLYVLPLLKDYSVFVRFWGKHGAEILA